jgi:polyisoprenoid-binding protein YceI
MKTFIAAVIAATALSAAAQTTLKVDTTATKAEWVGKKVAGEHKGNIKAKGGELIVTGELLTGGNVVIDTNTITCSDLTDKEWNDKLVGHLKAPDFFDTAKYPEATLKIKSSKKTAKGLDVTADLTIKGKTQPITFTATDVKATADSYSAKAAIVVNRIKYGIEYNSGKGDKSIIASLGDKMISDEFTLNVDLAAKK